MRATAGSLGVIMVLVPMFAGCTNRQVYEGLQERNRQQCYQLPQGEMERCLQRNDVDYEEYRRQREETLTDPAASPAKPSAIPER